MTAAFDETTEEYQSLMERLRKLEALPVEVEHFRTLVTEFVEEHLSQLEKRMPSAYVATWQGYQTYAGLVAQAVVDQWTDLEGEALQRTRRWDREEFAKRTLRTSFTLHTTFEAAPDPKAEGEVILAERVLIPDLETFLSLDLIRGFATGHRGEFTLAELRERFQRY